MHPKHSYLFLDRDGTLIVDKHYLHKSEEVEFCAGVFEGLKILREAGFKFVVVTNQSGIGRGYFSETQMQAIHREISSQLSEVGIEIEAFLFCPHQPDEKCDCRKPRAGLLEDFSKTHPVDLENSWVIGDRLCDLELAHNFNLRSVWIQNKRHPDEIPKCRTKANVIANSIVEAAHDIIG